MHNRGKNEGSETGVVYRWQAVIPQTIAAQRSDPYRTLFRRVCRRLDTINPTTPNSTPIVPTATTWIPENHPKTAGPENSNRMNKLTTLMICLGSVTDRGGSLIVIRKPPAQKQLDCVHSAASKKRLFLLIANRLNKLTTISKSARSRTSLA